MSTNHLKEKKMIKRDQVAFIKKVFGIVGMMLSVSVFFVVLQTAKLLGTPEMYKVDEDGELIIPKESNEDGASWWNKWACTSVFVCILTVFLLIFASVPCNGHKSNRKSCNKIFPVNYILLFIFNMATTFILCFLCAKTDAYAVI
jgi:hypothetical protein